VSLDLSHRLAFRGDIAGKRKRKRAIRPYENISLQIFFLPDRDFQRIASIDQVAVRIGDSLCLGKCEGWHHRKKEGEKRWFASST
jgi:hypothetical protein